MARLLFVLLSACCLVFFSFTIRAEEGMWIPSLLEYHNIDIMQERGLRLSDEDIYSINEASLKDAVVIFGRGCTGHMISGNGLLLTNHHCSYGNIQSLSTVENDYLTKGYWAMNPDEELPLKGLSVTFLIRIEDVTELVLEGINNEVTETQRTSKIDSNIRKISGEAVKGTHHKAVIKPFFFGNEFFMFIYEEYTDIRLVGTPPSGIGDFGRDYDNWIWPRHTGDFSLFRVYSDTDNMPAGYSSDNVPFKPKKFLSISLSGVNEGDFTMLLGYPGTTNQYLISSGINLLYKKSLPHKIELREKRMEIMNKYMKESELVNLQYSSKYRSESNAWKKWQGVVMGMERINGLALKIRQEEEFSRWVSTDNKSLKEYGGLLPEMYRLYDELEKFTLAYDYGQECIFATEIFNMFLSLGGLIAENRNRSDEVRIKEKELFLSGAEQFFNNYHQPVDQEIFPAMLRYFNENIDEGFHPDIYNQIHKKFKGDYDRFSRMMFRKTKLASYEDMFNLLKDYPSGEASVTSLILEDPLYKVFHSFLNIYNENVYANYEFIKDEIDRLYRIYLKGLREMKPEKAFYPDANFTMRLTYGKVEGYWPADAVYYHYRTTLDGKIAKYHTGIYDYMIPEKLLELYNNKDFGRWADKNGKIITCFVASNHTSGGNSGSPVMNADGHLIGINFDRNWEGTINDYIYDPLQCRNISVDIRFILFIIDKFAGAGYLIDEMDLIN